MTDSENFVITPALFALQKGVSSMQSAKCNIKAAIESNGAGDFTSQGHFFRVLSRGMQRLEAQTLLI